MGWIPIVLVVGALGGALFWFGGIADRIEDDSAGMCDGTDRPPWGSKWLAILSGQDRRNGE